MKASALLPLLLVIPGVSLSACRKKATAPSVAAPPAELVAAQVGIDPSTLPSRDVIYAAISKYMAANKGRAAKDVNELVEKGYLKPLPALPSGKGYELDQRGATLKIADK